MQLGIIESSISSNADLNDFIKPGVYKCSSNATASNLNNCPIDRAFVLTVRYSTGATDSYIRQELIDYANNEYVRSKTPQGWSAWKKAMYENV